MRILTRYILREVAANAAVGISIFTFVLFTNQTKPLHFSYQRFLENRLRAAFDFTGTPIRFNQRLKKRAPRRRVQERSDRRSSRERSEKFHARIKTRLRVLSSWRGKSNLD